VSHNNGWIGVDFDGTLAEYTTWQGPTHVGEPIAPMVSRVKRWLEEGREVRIFTARVSHDGTEGRRLEAARAKIAIYRWSIQVFGRILPVTNVKDFSMIELWDDRAVTVEMNTGLQLAPSSRGL
jgi:hypothetical protein